MRSAGLVFGVQSSDIQKTTIEGETLKIMLYGVLHTRYASRCGIGFKLRAVDELRDEGSNRA